MAGSAGATPMFPYATVKSTGHIWTVLLDRLEHFWVARDGSLLEFGWFDTERDALLYIEEQDA